MTQDLPHMSKRVPPIFWVALLWWTAFALMFAIQMVRMEQPLGTPATWERALQVSFGGWMTWVPLSLGLYWLVQRHPLERGRLLRSGAVLMAATLVVVFLRAAYVYLTNPIFGWYSDQPLPGFGSVLATSMSNNFLLAWIVVGLVHAMVFQQRSREREQKVSELEANLATTQLEALRAQLNPHFLFNALNSVAEMVHQDAELADRMLVSLAALLRDSLSSEQGQQRPLREEIELVQHYLMIEKIRLDQRLQVEWQVAATCLDIAVPALILQPLVENAIVHGIARQRAAGTLRLSGELRDDQLVLEVENSVAPQQAPATGTGIGLHSTRRRLQLFYGQRAQLSQRITHAGSYLVQLVIPITPRNPAGNVCRDRASA